VQDKIDCNKINEIREERNANSIYTGSTPSHAYVQSLSKPLDVEASFMIMNQAILMMPKAQVIDSRLIQDFKIKHQESNPRFKIQEKKSRSNKLRLHIG